MGAISTLFTMFGHLSSPHLNQDEPLSFCCRICITDSVIADCSIEFDQALLIEKLLIEKIAFNLKIFK